MKRLADDVARELRRFGPQAGLGKIVEAWPAAVGEAIARNAWPARIARDGTLHVHASSSAWAFELAHLEGEIRERLGALAPPRVRFAPGPLPEADLPKTDETPAEPFQPSPEDVELAVQIAAGIGDEKVRNLVARAAAASLARRTK
jgi:hypothetical protein